MPKGVYERTVSFAERFWSRVNKSDGCWEWTGPTKGNKTDYGVVTLHGKTMSASRAVWFLVNGDPGELFVLHTCDNSMCVKPDHLYLGTQQDNVRDREERGRGNVRAMVAVAAKLKSSKPFCKHGHPLAGRNLHLRKDGRECKACHVIRQREWTRRKNATNKSGAGI
jgi:hypothetical protein